MKNSGIRSVTPRRSHSTSMACAAALLWTMSCGVGCRTAERSSDTEAVRANEGQPANQRCWGEIRDKWFSRAIQELGRIEDTESANSVAFVTAGLLASDGRYDEGVALIREFLPEDRLYLHWP